MSARTNSKTRGPEIGSLALPPENAVHARGVRSVCVNTSGALAHWSERAIPSLHSARLEARCGAESHRVSDHLRPHRRSFRTPSGVLRQESRGYTLAHTVSGLRGIASRSAGSTARRRPISSDLGRHMELHRQLEPRAAVAALPCRPASAVMSRPGQPPVGDPCVRAELH